jgi:hypothetical protein
VICPLGPDDPTCDHHVIDVDAGDMAALEITVDSNDGTDLDIVVFDADGHRVATAASGAEIEVLTMRASTGLFTVSVASWFSAPLDPEAGRFEATAALTDGEPRSDLFCAGSVPDLPVAPDASMELSVLTLLDGIPVERATSIVERARVSWDDAGIDLAVTFDDSFEARSVGAGIDHQGQWRERADSWTMFDDARAHVGGAVPSPHDAVIVMTDKDLNDNGAEYMGVANCIGALGSPTAAFALGEAWADEWESPLGHQPDLSSITWSHELGHLANAPHHYGECTMGAGRLDAGDASHVGEATCSLMQYIGSPGSAKFTTANLYFSHLNVAVVRAHVMRHTS